MHVFAYFAFQNVQNTRGCIAAPIGAGRAAAQNSEFVKTSKTHYFMSFLDPRDPQNATFDAFLGVKLDIAFFMVSGGDPGGTQGMKKNKLFYCVLRVAAKEAPPSSPASFPEVKKLRRFHTVSSVLPAKHHENHGSSPSSSSPLSSLSSFLRRTPQGTPEDRVHPHRSPKDPLEGDS